MTVRGAFIAVTLVGQYMADTLLELDGVSVRRGIDIVLSDFSLSLDEGQCIILHGENGLGKSTVIEVAARLLPMERAKCATTKVWYMIVREGEKALNFRLV